MVVDAAIVAMAFLLACRFRWWASFIVLSQHVLIYAIVNFWWVNSSFWAREFFLDYHLYQAIINSIFLLILWRVSKESHAVIIGSGLLVMVSVIAFYNRLLYLGGYTNTQFYEFILNAYPFMRLGAISLQLAGLFHDADRNGRRIRKLHHRSNTRDGSANFDRLSFAKIYK